MAGGGVRTDINDSVARVIFFHPKSNSLPGKVLADLAGEFNRLKDDKSIKVIILQSEGEKAFCAGASFDELLAINDFDTGKEFFMGFARVINAMRKCPQFIIARVQGKAVGGGVGLIAAADYALAVENALIKLSEFALGIGPFVVGPAVERKIGRAAFSQISIDYEWYDSEWSKGKGLFAETFATIEELDNGVTGSVEGTIEGYSNPYFFNS
ncbi:MAG: enoyl-CoA hydratase/isomerase family protein [Bacteroidota bacterium]